MCFSFAQPSKIIYQTKSIHYSIARRYGRVASAGHTYVYEPRTDMLLRQDIYLKRKNTNRKRAAHPYADARESH